MYHHRAREEALKALRRQLAQGRKERESEFTRLDAEREKTRGSLEESGRSLEEEPARRQNADVNGR